MAKTAPSRALDPRVRRDCNRAAVAEGWKAFGRAANGDRLARMERSPQWKGGRFVNPQPLSNDFWRMLTGRVTWLGHAALLVEIDGYRIRSYRRRWIESTAVLAALS